MITTNPADQALASWTREEARPAAERLKRSGQGGEWWMQGKILFSYPVFFWHRLIPG